MNAKAEFGTKRGSKEATKVTAWVDVPINRTPEVFEEAVNRALTDLKAQMLAKYDEHSKGKKFDPVTMEWVAAK